MHIQHPLSLSARLTHHWRLALISLLLVGLFLPQPVQAAPTWTTVASMNAGRQYQTATLLPSGKVLVVGGRDGLSYLTNAEVYDPSADTWTTVAPMNTARMLHTATLLPSGKVLVAGGQGSLGFLTSAEVYDPSMDNWTNVASLHTARRDQTATLLPGGQVLVAGGYNGSYLASAEVYDPSADTWTTTAESLTNARQYHTATLLPDGQVLITGGWNGSVDLASAEVYDPSEDTWTTVGSLNTGRWTHTATLLPSGKVLVVGGRNSNYLSSAELYNPSTKTWTTTVASPLTYRGYHTATLLPNGKVLVTGGIGTCDNWSTIGFLTCAQVYDPITPSWTNAASLTTARGYQTATLLANGKVLVAGGSNSTDSYLASTEVYDDPSAGSWATVTSLATVRSSPTATLLPNGQVLVAGGYNWSDYLTSAELYDPNLNTWTATAASMHIARNYHTATLLPSGKVLVAGGWNGSGLNSAEVYDPSADTWTNVAALHTARRDHTATLLPSGKVLVAGGVNTADGNLTSAEVYDPSTDTWTNVAALNTARFAHSATLLPGGKVLVAAGSGDFGFLINAEVYDPSANTWTPVTSLNTLRSNHTATLLPGGQVLVAGGWNASGDLASTEVYDPSLNTWTIKASLNTARQYHTATLLPNGKVLIAGGNNSFSPRNDAEVYDPSLDTWTNVAPLNAARANHTATLLPNGKVLVAGGGADNSVEVYDRGLGFSNSWRPVVNPISSPLTLGNALALTGSGYRGFQFAEASGGGTNNSATNYPLVQIQRLDNKQWLWVLPSASSVDDTSFTSLPVTNMLAGPALVTVFVNGIPSASQPLNLNYATSTSILSPDITYNANGVVTVTVSSSEAIPAGVVTLSVDSGGLITQTLAPVYGSSPQQATATFTLTTPSAGTHTLSASYAAQADFAASSASGALNVNQAATTTALVSSLNPSTFGQTVTFTATVASGAGTPTGTVTFQDGATTLGTDELSSGIASFNTALLTGGTHTITAEYSAAGNYGGSVSDALSQTVDQANTTTTLGSSQNPSSFGQSVTFTATVTSGAGTPTGTVEFKDGGTTIPGCGSQTLISGQATCMTSSLAVGTHTITAEYDDDSNFNTSTGTLTGGQVVNQANSTTTLSSSQNPSSFGQSVTLTATVSSGAGMPTGTVEFKDGGATITGCGSQTLISGHASCVTSSLAIGTHTITAEYNGDTNFSTSTGTLTGGQVVDQAATTTALVSSPNPSTFGQTVTFTATVASGTGTPTGTVTFKNGAITLGTDTLSGGIATFNTASLAGGIHTITAEYNGDTNFSTSTGTLTGGQVVDRAATTTALVSSPNPSTFGQTVTFTATVSSGAGTPTGTVTFKSSATTLGTDTLSGGIVTFSTSVLTAGTHTITAEYNGDTNFHTSTGTLVGGQVVNQAATTTALVSSPNPSNFGQTVTFTVTVASVAGTPTGTVTFKDGATMLGTDTLSGGIATFSTAVLAAGTHTITAVYNAAGNYGGSVSDALVMRVNHVLFLPMILR